MEERAATLTDDGWSAIFAAASHSLAHLEMRDSYAADYEDERFAWWREHHTELPREVHPWWDLTAATLRRGVTMRRARIVSEPVSEYIHFEHAGTWQNVEAGEMVRWLPRRLASDLALPGNDFWLFDAGLHSAQVLFNLFDGDGHPIAEQLTSDPAVVKLCADAFEAVWSRGIDHDEYPLS